MACHCLSWLVVCLRLLAVVDGLSQTLVWVCSAFLWSPAGSHYEETYIWSLDVLLSGITHTLQLSSALILFCWSVSQDLANLLPPLLLLLLHESNHTFGVTELSPVAVSSLVFLTHTQAHSPALEFWRAPPSDNKIMAGLNSTMAAVCNYYYYYYYY